MPKALQQMVQIHPVICRLCASIQGTSPAHLADCLGLDSSKVNNICVCHFIIYMNAYASFQFGYVNANLS